MSVSTYGFAPCSNGNSMLHPTECPPPSRHPLLAASMMPGPAPVMIENPERASSFAVSSAARYCGSSGPVLAEPKTDTPLSIPASVSNPSINSLMILSTRQGSVRVKSTCGPATWRSFSSSVIGGRSRIDSSTTRTAPERRLASRSCDGGVRPASRWPSSVRSRTPWIAARSTVRKASRSSFLPVAVRGTPGLWPRFFGMGGSLPIALIAFNSVAAQITGHAPPGAKLSIPQLGLHTLADSAGHFRFDSVSDGRWAIEARTPDGVALTLATVSHGAASVTLGSHPLCGRDSSSDPLGTLSWRPAQPAPGTLIMLTATGDSAQAIWGRVADEPVMFRRDTGKVFVALAAVPLDVCTVHARIA